MSRASCRALPVAWWFARPGRSRRAAVRICGRCPVRDECLAYALDLPDVTHGVWGGLTLEDRRALARRRSVTDERLSQSA